LQIPASDRRGTMTAQACGTSISLCFASTLEATHPVHLDIEFIDENGGSPSKSRVSKHSCRLNFVNCAQKVTVKFIGGS